MPQEDSVARMTLLLSLCFMFILTSCLSPKGTPSGSGQSFEIALLQGDEISRPPGLGNTTQSSWQVLQKAFPSKVVGRISLEDIETYQWEEQIITLTPHASKEIAATCEIDMLRAPCGFVVVVNGTPLYGGLITSPMTEQAIDYPVIYLKEDGGRVTLAIRPYHSVLGLDQDDPAWQAIRDIRIESIFARLGKLQ